MASAKKCDRCGKYYDKNEQHQACSNGYKSIINGVAFTMKNGELAETYDLCDDCIARMKEWLKGEK